MDRIQKRMASLVGLLAVVLVLWLMVFPPGRGHQPPTGDQKTIVVNRAKEAATALKNGDMDHFSKMVHPEKGVRFAPWHPSAENPVFTRAWVKTALTNPTVYSFGLHPASGEPIAKTFAEFRSQHLADRDYAAAPTLTYNGTVSPYPVDGVFTLYPDAKFVEFHFPGDPPFEDLGWEGLWVVLEEKDGVWYVVCVAKDFWTP